MWPLGVGQVCSGSVSKLQRRGWWTMCLFVHNIESSSYSKLSSSKAKPYLVKPSASRNDFIIKTRCLRKGTKGGEMVKGQHEKGIITTGRNILISWVSLELHSLKILWGCREERGTDSEMAPQCSPASYSETAAVWQAISWQKPRPNLITVIWFQLSGKSKMYIFPKF